MTGCFSIRISVLAGQRTEARPGRPAAVFNRPQKKRTDITIRRHPYYIPVKGDRTADFSGKQAKEVRFRADFPYFLLFLPFGNTNPEKTLAP